ncbi:MAG: hypothetical protein ABI318_00545, partial [Chthoniobacteraceae bacterium]
MRRFHIIAAKCDPPSERDAFLPFESGSDGVQFRSNPKFHSKLKPHNQMKKTALAILLPSLSLS